MNKLIDTREELAEVVLGLQVKLDQVHDEMVKGPTLSNEIQTLRKAMGALTALRSEMYSTIAKLELVEICK